MTFKKSDWDEMCRRLLDAREWLSQVRDDASERRLLANAIWALWTFGEYAVNVSLELEGRDPDQSHGHDRIAQELFASGLLGKDYSAVLAQLGRYRLKAFYKGYSKERSVHFSPRNVEDCLVAMESLKDEVLALLRARKRISDDS